MIENNILEIRWPNGNATIRMNEFFPTSQDRTKQLFRKFILLSDDSRQITEDVIRWLSDRYGELDPNLLKDYASKYEAYDAELKKYDVMLKANEAKRPEITKMLRRKNDKVREAQLLALRGEREEFSKTIREQMSKIRTLRDLAKHNYGDLNRKLKLCKGDLEVAKSFSEGSRK